MPESFGAEVGGGERLASCDLESFVTTGLFITLLGDIASCMPRCCWHCECELEGLWRWREERLEPSLDPRGERRMLGLDDSGEPGESDMVGGQPLDGRGNDMVVRGVVWIDRVCQARVLLK